MKWLMLGLFWALPALAGNESHGGSGVLLEKFLGGLNAPAVELFDTLEYDKEFIPGTEAEFAELIEPKLKVLKSKLPRTGHYLEKILTRGIKPRWYFVKYTLKKTIDPNETTNLILAFEGVQIALNDGRKVQIQEGFYNGLEPRSRARLLVHEAVRSAIGMGYRQDTDKVKSITSLLMHNNLEQFSKEDLASELMEELDGCNRGGDQSPLYRLVVGDLTLTHHEIRGWEDQTYLQDGLTPGNCSYETDQCVFRDNVRGILWTESAPGQKLGTVLGREAAEASCTNLKEWANDSCWKLPNFSEVQDAWPRLQHLFGRVQAMGPSNGAFWTSSTPFTDPWNSFIEGLPLQDTFWAIRLEGGQVRSVRKDSPLPFLCVSDQLPQWKMVARDSDGKLTGECKAGSQCALLSLRTRMLYSEPGANYKPAYLGDRRIDDVGLASRSVAQTRCNQSDWGGIKGWRLPSVRELRTASFEGLFTAALANEEFGNLRGEFWVDNSGFSSTPVMPIDATSLGSRGEGMYGLARYVCVNGPLNGTELKGVLP